MAAGRTLAAGAALAFALLGPGCATAPPPAAPAPPGAPFGLRDPAVTLPPGTLRGGEAERLERGMDALRAGDVATARRRFSSGASGSQAPAPFRLGVAYCDLVVSRYEVAREILEPLVRQNPQWAPAREALADLDAAEGRWREALNSYRALLVLLPGDPRILEREADVERTLLERGSADTEAALAVRDLPHARREALTLVELDPDSPRGYELLARVAEAEGSLEDAWTAASKAHALDPADDGWTRATAALAMKTGRFSEAVALYTKLARHDPGAAPLLDEARFEFQVQNLPEVARHAALSPRVTRAQFAALAWWLVPEVREARVPAAPEVAVDAVDRPEGQALVRAIALGIFRVAPATHRVGADQLVSRAEAADLLRRVALLVAGGRPLPECLSAEKPAPASLDKCGILPATTSRAVSGREMVRGLEAAARAGRGGDSR
ncbi:MAG: tetratricopeptide repeat protein [Acidithiobacillales bacterium]